MRERLLSGANGVRVTLFIISTTMIRNIDRAVPATVTHAITGWVRMSYNICSSLVFISPLSDVSL